MIQVLNKKNVVFKTKEHTNRMIRSTFATVKRKYERLFLDKQIDNK